MKRPTTSELEKERDLQNSHGSHQGENVRPMFDDGIVGQGILACGQGIGLTHDIPTLEELFGRMAAETEQALSRYQLIGNRFKTL
ncbi:MAG: hypothetical protein R2875_18090 [Desulfobacterales bacterium]